MLSRQQVLLLIHQPDQWLRDTETAARAAERLATPISLLIGYFILSRPKDDDVSSAINMDHLGQNPCCPQSITS